MVNYSKYKSLVIKKQDKVTSVTMNQPEKLNAIDSNMHRELEEIFYDLQKDEDVLVVILTGAGKAFSAGGDIKWFKARFENPEANPIPNPTHAIQLLNNIIGMTKPLVAAVNGPAIGLGATLALFADIIIASENAKFADPHVNVGLVAGDGGCAIWPLLMGFAKAKEYLLTGNSLSATDAEKMGMINKVVPPDKLMDEAINFAQGLAAKPPLAVQHTKLSINKILLQVMNLVVPTSTPLEFLTFQSKDHEEAVNAFLEKRTPKYVGK